jgi:hypothetical protein
MHGKQGDVAEGGLGIATWNGRPAQRSRRKCGANVVHYLTLVLCLTIGAVDQL